MKTQQLNKIIQDEMKNDRIATLQAILAVLMTTPNAFLDFIKLALKTNYDTVFGYLAIALREVFASDDSCVLNFVRGMNIVKAVAKFKPALGQRIQIDSHIRDFATEFREYGYLSNSLSTPTYKIPDGMGRLRGAAEELKNNPNGVCLKDGIPLKDKMFAYVVDNFTHKDFIRLNALKFSMSEKDVIQSASQSVDRTVKGDYDYYEKTLAIESWLTGTVYKTIAEDRLGLSFDHNTPAKKSFLKLDFHFGHNPVTGKRNLTRQQSDDVINMIKDLISPKMRGKRIPMLLGSTNIYGLPKGLYDGKTPGKSKPLCMLPIDYPKFPYALGCLFRDKNYDHKLFCYFLEDGSQETIDIITEMAEAAQNKSGGNEVLIKKNFAKPMINYYNNKLFSAGLPASAMLSVAALSNPKKKRVSKKTSTSIVAKNPPKAGSKSPIKAQHKTLVTPTTISGNTP